MVGMRVRLPLFGLILASAGCAAPAAVVEDGWGVQRRFGGRAPVLLSISQINGGTAPARGDIASTAVRSRARGRHRVAVSAEDSIAAQWTRGAALFDGELERALDWLATLGATESRALELRLTLMPEHGARQLERRHPAAETLVIDLLVPVPDHPRSRGAALEAALATGLHEVSHVLRPADARSREDDEYRASLVAACYRIAGMQDGDRLDLATPVPTSAPPREFTRAHSRDAALKVKRDLAASLGAPALAGNDLRGRTRLQGFCAARIGAPGA